MKEKKAFKVMLTVLLSFVVITGITFAATEWPGDNTFTGTVNHFKKGIKIGEQGSGGVTFFNGTIVNNTTNDGVDNPVAFGDNVRIDGAIQRGTNKTGDGWGVKIDDNLQVNGRIEIKEKKGYFSIAGSDFTGEKVTDRGNAVYQGSILYPNFWALGESSYYTAPVTLPQSAVIQSIRIRGLDNDQGVGKDFYVQLERFNSLNKSMPTKEQIFGVASADEVNPSKFKEWKATIPANIGSGIGLYTIDNEHYVYVLRFRNDSDFVNVPASYKIALEGVIIEYTYTQL